MGYEVRVEVGVEHLCTPEQRMQKMEPNVREAH
jgi:hypothetical protein